MLSEEKIKIMTNLAMFEKREGRKISPAGRYFKWDYISSKLFRSFFSYTFSFLICLALWGLYHMEQWLKTMDLRTVSGMGVQIGVVYGIGLAAYIGISIFVYVRRYANASRGMKVYLSKLKRLDKRYEGTSRPLKRTKGGRTT